MCTSVYLAEGRVLAAGNVNGLLLSDPCVNLPCDAVLGQTLQNNMTAVQVGKTTMDELAYSSNGENVHYGTPANPAAPGRIPGGSSSGSAVPLHHHASVNMLQTQWFPWRSC